MSEQPREALLCLQMLGFVDIFPQSETRGAPIGVEKMCAAPMIRGDGRRDQAQQRPSTLRRVLWMGILLAKDWAPGSPPGFYSTIDNGGSPAPVALEDFVEQRTAVAGADEFQPADAERIDFVA